MINFINQVKVIFIMQKNSFTSEELIACGKGDLFGEGNAKLPLPPMLMFDRITQIDNKNETLKLIDDFVLFNLNYNSTLQLISEKFNE